MQGFEYLMRLRRSWGVFLSVPRSSSAAAALSNLFVCAFEQTSALLYDIGTSAYGLMTPRATSGGLVDPRVHLVQLIILRLGAKTTSITK